MIRAGLRSYDTLRIVRQAKESHIFQERLVNDQKFAIPYKVMLDASQVISLIHICQRTDG